MYLKSSKLKLDLLPQSPSPSPSQNNVFEFPSSLYMGKELWEVTAACHGPEDPPAALLRAADMYREPLLVLIASCYEVSFESFSIS